MHDLTTHELEPGDAWSEQLIAIDRRRARVFDHEDGLRVALTLEACSHGGPLHLVISVCDVSSRYPYLHEETRVLRAFVEPMHLRVVHRSMRCEHGAKHRTVYCVMPREGIQ